MNDLLNQMKNDSKGMGHNSMGKIGAVANDVADTEKEIQDLEDKLKTKKDYKKHLSENINSKPKIFTKQALNEMKLECNGWFLDGEIMLEVKRLNLSFAEIPTVFHEIEWRASFVNWKAVLEMFYSLLKYRLKYWFYKN